MMCKKFIAFVISISIIITPFLLIGGNVNAATYVHGYTRKNGTYVAPHYRSSPDGNPYNNWSYPGNTNPYTGKKATGNPDTYLRNYYNNSPSYSSPSYSSHTAPNYTLSPPTTSFDSPALMRIKYPSLVSVCDFDSFEQKVNRINEQAITQSSINQQLAKAYKDFLDECTANVLAKTKREQEQATINACPENAYKNSSGQCQCNVGYGVIGGQCVLAERYCQEAKGVNWHYNATDESCVYHAPYVPPTPQPVLHPTPQVRGEQVSSSDNQGNPLNLDPHWLVKNKKFAEVFYVTNDYKLRWIKNENVAFKFFGSNWNQIIHEYDDITGYGFETALEFNSNL